MPKVFMHVCAGKTKVVYDYLRVSIQININIAYIILNLQSLTIIFPL